MSLRRQVHAVNRGASRPGQQVGVQKPHAGQVFQHRLQLGGDAGTAVKLGLVDENGQVVSGAERSVSFDGYKTPILDTVTAAIRDFIAPPTMPRRWPASAYLPPARSTAAAAWWPAPAATFPGWFTSSTRS